MKPRTRWLRKFATWFFNASPDWVPPADDEPSPARDEARPANERAGHPAGASEERGGDRPGNPPPRRGPSE